MTQPKFHITKSGAPDVCNAKDRACPLGGEHYDSMPEAMRASMASPSAPSLDELMDQEKISLAQAQDMAVRLMKEHGVGHVRFGFNRRTSAAGITVFMRGEPTSIELSEGWTRTHTRAQIRNTILHEISHAKAGHSAGHGPRWQAVARQVGAAPQACFSASDEEKENVYPWKGECLKCGKTSFKGTAPKRVVSCGACSNGEGFHVSRIMTWSKNGQVVDGYDMPPSYRREYAYIQNKYGDQVTEAAEEKYGDSVPENSFVKDEDGGCHYYGALSSKAVEDQEPAAPKKSDAQKAAELAEFIKVLEAMYMEKFGTRPEDDGVDAGQLLAMFNEGLLN